MASRDELSSEKMEWNGYLKLEIAWKCLFLFQSQNLISITQIIKHNIIEHYISSKIRYRKIDYLLR